MELIDNTPLSLMNPASGAARFSHLLFLAAVIVALVVAVVNSTAGELPPCAPLTDLPCASDGL
jgi:hypothetical protein